MPLSTGFVIALNQLRLDICQVPNKELWLLRACMERLYQYMIRLNLTCRGDYAIDVGRNIIHGSDSTEASTL